MGIYILAADSDRYQNLVWATEETRKAMWARFRGLPISQNWSPAKVKVLHDEKQNRNLPPSDFPSLGGYVPTFSQRAIEALGDLLIPNGEILALVSDEGTYFAFNVTTLANVLDHQRSEIKRFTDGRVMRIVAHAFLPEKLPGLTIFKLPEAPGMYTYVTDDFVRRVEEAGLTGFWFRAV